MTDKAKASEHDLRERMQQIREREEKVIAADWMVVPVLEHASVIHAGEYSSEGEPDLIIEVCSATHKDDADFIAHSRADIPWLLTQLAAILEENQRLSKANKVLTDDIATDNQIWKEVHELLDGAGIPQEEAGSFLSTESRVELLVARLGKMREALQTIADWPFDIMGDCVKDAKNLAEAALAE